MTLITPGKPPPQSVGLAHHGVPNFSELPARGRDAFVTLITQGGCIDDGAGRFGYIAGALALVESIRETGTKLRVLVAMTSAVVNPRGVADYVESVSGEPVMLQDIEVETLEVLGERRRHLLNRNRWRGMFTKLLLWDQGRYFDKFIYIDTDHIVLHNLDRLIKLCQDGVCAVNDSTNPSENIWDRHYFNAGLMVFQPNRDDFVGLLDAVFNNSLTTGQPGRYNARAFAGDGPPEPSSSGDSSTGTVAATPAKLAHTWITWRSYSLMEQDLLNIYFITRTTYLAPGYNMWATLLGGMLVPGQFYATQAEVDRFVKPRVHAIHGTLWSKSDGYAHAFVPQTRRLWARFWEGAAAKAQLVALEDTHQCAAISSRVRKCTECNSTGTTRGDRSAEEGPLPPLEECWLDCI